jgi:hypothetical protein
MAREDVDFVTGLFSGAAQMNKGELVAALPELIRYLEIYDERLAVEAAGWRE